MCAFRLYCILLVFVNISLSCVSIGRSMSVEVDVLLQEAKESIEAAQNYRSELQQRLHGLNQARKQVPQFICTSAGLKQSSQVG